MSSFQTAIWHSSACFISLTVGPEHVKMENCLPLKFLQYPWNQVHCLTFIVRPLFHKPDSRTIFTRICHADGGNRAITCDHHVGTHPNSSSICMGDWLRRSVKVQTREHNYRFIRPSCLLIVATAFCQLCFKEMMMTNRNDMTWHDIHISRI